MKKSEIVVIRYPNITERAATIEASGCLMKITDSSWQM